MVIYTQDIMPPKRALVLAHFTLAKAVELYLTQIVFKCIKQKEIPMILTYDNDSDRNNVENCQHYRPNY